MGDDAYRLWTDGLAWLQSASSAGAIINGLIALALSLALWEVTHSFVGWLALFVPGAALVFVGWAAIIRGFL